MEKTPTPAAGETGTAPTDGALADAALADAALVDADYERLDALLEGLGNDDAMIVEELDGFLAALACSAEPIAPDEYLPEILGVPHEEDAPAALAHDKEPPARPGQEREAIAEPAPEEGACAELLGLIARHAHQVREALAAHRFAPVLAHDDQDQVDGVAWAVGFLRGVEMRPDGWEAMLEEGEFADALDAMETLAATLDDDAPAQVRRPGRRERDQLIDQMMADVADMHEFFRPFRTAGTTPQAMRVETVRRDQPKIGRNDPCPCGSGKKYKLCCGRN